MQVETRRHRADNYTFHPIEFTVNSPPTRKRNRIVFDYFTCAIRPPESYVEVIGLAGEDVVVLSCFGAAAGTAGVARPEVTA